MSHAEEKSHLVMTKLSKVIYAGCGKMACLEGPFQPSNFNCSADGNELFLTSRKFPRNY